ncbi:carbohydrate ABC transporter permease [Agrobacterium tumefaciens]|nr:carbohydrate ABC transporter permease [Agrobacterium tumefaciens]
MSHAYTISGHFSGRRTMATARYVLLLALAGLYLTPLVLALISSFKTPAELQQVLSLPSGFYTRNYAEGWDRIGHSILNSFMITIPAVILSVFVGALAAFPLSHTRIPGERYLFLLLLAGMLVPQQTVQIPLFLIMRALRLYNTIPGMWLVHVAYGVPFCAFFMRNFFSSMPRSMFEAARIDGCGPAGYFFKILLPASASGLAALAIVQSRSVWNDLFFGLTITSGPSTHPAPVALYSLIGGLEVDDGPIMAATVISILPMMVAFLLFQKAFTRGLLGGSSK